MAQVHYMTPTPGYSFVATCKKCGPPFIAGTPPECINVADIIDIEGHRFSVIRKATKAEYEEYRRRCGTDDKNPDIAEYFELFID